MTVSILDSVDSILTMEAFISSIDFIFNARGDMRGAGRKGTFPFRLENDGKEGVNYASAIQH